MGQTDDNEGESSGIIFSTGTAMGQSIEREYEEDQQQQLNFGLSATNNSVSNTQIVHQPLLRLTGHNDVVVSGEWIFGGDQLITAFWDRTANVYDTETGKVINVLSG